MSNHFDNFKLPNNLSNDNSISLNHSNSSIFNSNDIINANPNNSSSSACVKETGIIEKMLVSYGFIQCCERQARLFFHFSQYLGNTDRLKIGDPVEYEMSYDRRTGKPVAINIKKITSDDFMTKLSKTERLSAVIATEITNDREGRVAFENLGEFFFLPFSQEDVSDNVILKAKDKVSFILTADESGNYRAKNIQLEASSQSKIQGYVTSIKDTFGFIERSDNMANIFFHFSDCPNFKALNVGDYVEFNITTRKNKELATSVNKIVNTGEEISETIYKGKILKYNGRSNLASGVLHCPDLNKELVFYDKDVKGNYTIYPSDLVNFQMATDRRSESIRACNITFISDTFSINSEARERGYIASLKETYGFIKCPSKEGSLIYFKTTELLDSSISLKLNDEIEFTYITDAQSKKCQAIRISLLPNGTLFNILSSKKNNFDKLENNNINNNESNYPLIDFNTEIVDTQNESGIVKAKENGDAYSNNNWTKDLLSLFKNLNIKFDSSNDVDKIETEIIIFGIIVASKDNYGFIESIDGEKDYFFHVSSCIDNIKLGQAVKFNVLFSNGKWKASNVREKQDVSLYDGELSEVYSGIVLRTVQVFNTDQKEYTGIIAKIDQPTDINGDFESNDKFEFSMISCKFFKDFISVGDIVKFQVGINSVTKQKRAYNVEVVRERVKGTITFIHRLYGFLKPELSLAECNNIYFNKSEVSGDAKLKIGDIVDFYFVKNSKTDKTYAIDISKVESEENNTTVIDRKIFKNLLKNVENGPKVIAIREPKVPDGSKGFKNEDNRQ